MINSKIYLGPLNTSRIERSTSSKVESGYQLEKRIFGEDIKKLNEIQARFLLDPSSWNSKNFIEKFLDAKNLIGVDRTKKVQTIRMKVRSNYDEEKSFGRYCYKSLKKQNRY